MFDNFAKRRLEKEVMRLVLEKDASWFNQPQLVQAELQKKSSRQDKNVEALCCVVKYGISLLMSLPETIKDDVDINLAGHHFDVVNIDGITAMWAMQCWANALTQLSPARRAAIIAEVEEREKTHRQAAIVQEERRVAEVAKLEKQRRLQAEAAEVEAKRRKHLVECWKLAFPQETAALSKTAQLAAEAQGRAEVARLIAADRNWGYKQKGNGMNTLGQGFSTSDIGEDFKRMDREREQAAERVMRGHLKQMRPSVDAEIWRRIESAPDQMALNTRLEQAWQADVQRRKESYGSDSSVESEPKGKRKGNRESQRTQRGARVVKGRRHEIQDYRKRFGLRCAGLTDEEVLQRIDRDAPQPSSASDRHPASAAEKMNEAKKMNEAALEAAQAGDQSRMLGIVNEVIARFSGSQDAAVRAEVVRAFGNKAIIANQMGHPDEALEVADVALRQFGSESSPIVRYRVMRILVSKAAQLKKAGRVEDALAVVNEVKARLIDSDLEDTIPFAATLLTDNVLWLFEMGRDEEAIKASDEVSRLFHKWSSEPSVRYQICKAALLKVETLFELENTRVARDVWEGILERFGSDSNKEIQLLIEEERNRRSDELSLPVSRLNKDIAEYLSKWKDLDASSFGAFIKETKVPAFVVVHASQSPHADARAAEFLGMYRRVYGIYTMGALTSQQPLPHPMVASAAFDLDAVPAIGQELSAKLRIAVADAPVLALFNEAKLVGVCRWNENPDVLIDRLFHHLNGTSLGAFDPTVQQPDDEPMVSRYRQIVREKKQWAVAYIPDSQPPFGYTIGLHHLHQHPEVMLAFPDPNITARTLNIIGTRIQKGERFEAGQAYDGIFEGYKVAFMEMDDDDRKDSMGFAIGFYKNVNFPSLRCYYPDEKGLFPWEEGCSPNVIMAQIAL